MYIQYLGEPSRLQAEESSTTHTSKLATQITPKICLWKGFETRSEIALGTTFVDVDGSRERFLTESFIKSDINLRRFLFDLRPTKMGPKPFDFATVSGSGFGNSEPYQHFDVRLAKRNNYDFSSEFRKFNYFFDLPSFAQGLYPENSVVRRSNYQLRLFTDKLASIDLTYRRNQNYGSALYTAKLPLDIFQISQPRRLNSNEYSAGTTVRAGSLGITLKQSLLRFKDNSPIFPNQFNSKGLTGSHLKGRHRDTLTRISIPVSHLVARYSPVSRWDLVGRYMYSRSNLQMRSFNDFQLSLGTDQNPTQQIISSLGTGQKPTHTANFSQTIQLNNRLALHHQSDYRSYSITGLIDTFGVLSFFNGLGKPPTKAPIKQQGSSLTDYEFMRHRLDLDFDLTDPLSLLGGYRYTDRALGFVSTFDNTLGQPPLPAQVRIQHTGRGGIAWRPIRQLGFRVEGERSVASSAFYRIEPTCFLRWRFRGEARPSKQ